MDPPALLNLPIEIRLEIYKLILLDDSIDPYNDTIQIPHICEPHVYRASSIYSIAILDDDDDCLYPCGDEDERLYPCGYCSNLPPGVILLLVNKQIYWGARAFVWSHHRFWFHDVSHLLTFTSRLDAKATASIKSIAVTVAFPFQYSDTEQDKVDVSLCLQVESMILCLSELSYFRSLAVYFQASHKPSALPWITEKHLRPWPIWIDQTINKEEKGVKSTLTSYKVRCDEQGVVIDSPGHKLWNPLIALCGLSNIEYMYVQVWWKCCWDEEALEQQGWPFLLKRRTNPFETTRTFNPDFNFTSSSDSD